MSAEQLLVRIDSTTESLRRELKRAEDRVGGFQRNVDTRLQKVDRQFERASRGVRTMQKAMTSLAGIVAGSALARGLDNALQQLQEIDRQARSLNIDTEQFQELDFAFKQFGARTEDVSDALNTLADRAQDAVQGAQGMQEDFGLVGIAVEDLRGKEPAELFELVARRIRETDNVSRQNAAAVRLLGDELGNRLLPLLKGVDGGFQGTTQRARELGVVMDDELIEAGSEAARSLNEVKAVFSAQFNRAVADNAENFNELAETLSSEKFLNGMETITTGLSEIAEEAGRAVEQVGNLANLLQGDINARDILDNSILGVAARAAGQDSLFGESQTPEQAENERRLEAARGRMQRLQEQAERQRASINPNVPEDLAEQRREQLEQTEQAIDAQREKIEQLTAARERLNEVERQAQTDTDQAGEQSQSSPDSVGGGGDIGVGRVNVVPQVDLDAMQEQLTMDQLGIGTVDMVPDTDFDQLQADMERMNELTARRDRLLRQIESPSERFNRRVDEMRELLDAGVISMETFDRATEQAAEQMRRAQGQAEETGDEMSQFAEQAANNMQDAFADFLFDPFSDGLDGMLDGFIQTARRMAAEAASQQILEGLFGGENGLGNTVDSVIGAFSSGGGKGKGGGGFGAAIGSFFGGFFADGGAPPVGRASVVGERGPELFVPQTPGQIVSNEDAQQAISGRGGQKAATGGSSQSVVVNQNIQTPDAQSFQKARGAISRDIRRSLR